MEFRDRAVLWFAVVWALSFFYVVIMGTVQSWHFSGLMYAVTKYIAGGVLVFSVFITGAVLFKTEIESVFEKKGVVDESERK